MPESNPQPTFRQRLEYALVRVAAALLTGLPLSVAVGLVRGLARLWHLLDRRHRRRMEEAVGLSLGVGPREARRIAGGVYPHFAAAAVDFLRLGGLDAAARQAAVHYDAEEADRLTPLVRERGAVFVTGHLGLWELAGAWAAWRGWTRGAIAKPLRNPLTNAWIRRRREDLGQEIWDATGALLHAIRTLRSGQCLGMLADQDGGANGAPIPFFGRPASTMTAAADLALRCRAPIIVGAVLREGPLRYRVVLTPPSIPNPDAHPDEERIRLLEEMNRRLEELIRQAPEQWIWSHRRWQTAEKWARGDGAPRLRRNADRQAPPA